MQDLSDYWRHSQMRAHAQNNVAESKVVAKPVTKPNASTDASGTSDLRQTPDHRARAHSLSELPKHVAQAWRSSGRAVRIGALLGGAALIVTLFNPAAHALNDSSSTHQTEGGMVGNAAVQNPSGPDESGPATPNASAQTATAAKRPPQSTARRPALTGPVTRLPLPRYVSLKGEEGNVRRGPSLSHRIDWVFRHAGMPLRVVGEFEHWRRVEDRDGAGGWVHYSLLSGVRTAIIEQDLVELRARPDLNASIIAQAENGAIVKLGSCNPGWCRISGSGAKGWVPKTAIWGVKADEIRP